MTDLSTTYTGTHDDRSGYEQVKLRGGTSISRDAPTRKYKTGSLRHRDGKWYARYRLSGKQIEKCFGDRKDLAEEFLIQRGKLSKACAWSWRDPSMIVEQYKPEDYQDGHVYLVRAGEYAKIGFTTTDIKLRLHSLISHCPFEVQLIFCIRGSLALEREIHATFRKHHMRNEWFAYSRTLEKFALSFSAPHLQSQVLVKGKTKVKSWMK